MPEANVMAAAPPSSSASQRFRGVVGRVVAPPVAAPGAILIVGIADEGGREMDRRNHRPSRLVDPAQRLRRQGVGTPAFAVSHTRAPGLDWAEVDSFESTSSHFA